MKEYLEVSPQQINIGDILSKKMNRSLPAWVVNLVERLIHQREINDILRRYNDLEGVDFMEALVKHFRLTLRIDGEELLPANKRSLFIANHPLGGLDGICISHLLGKHYDSSIQYIVNDLLYHLRPLRPIFVPVNKYGAQARQSLLLLQKALDGDLPVVTFPAGFCSRRVDGRIQDLEWKNSFLKQAVQSQRDIVPMFFNGRNSSHFYLIEDLRQRLGIKFSIGTALLPDEMFRAQGKAFNLIVGKPIPWQSLDISTPQSLRETALFVRNQVYNLSY